jgi:hypothetical protein
MGSEFFMCRIIGLDIRTTYLGCIGYIANHYIDVQN